MTEQQNDNSEPSKVAPTTGLATMVIHYSITVIIMVLLLALGVWGYLNFRNSDFFATVDRQQVQAQVEPPLIEAQHQRLSAAIEVWILVHGRPPASLEELVDRGLLLPSDLYYPRAGPLWHYERLPENYVLVERAHAGIDDEETVSP